MPQEKPSRREDDVEVKAPFGWSVRASGRHVTTLIAAVVAVVVVLYMIREHDLKQTEGLAAAVKDRNDQMVVVMQSQVKLQESMDSMLYVLSLEPEERKKLRLVMPPSLRTKLLNQERP